MAAYRILLSIVALTGMLIFSMPLSAAEETADTTTTTTDETPHPQSPEAIKQMADELEADRKARQAAAQERREMQTKDEPESPQTTADTSSGLDTTAELGKLKEHCEEAREAYVAPLREAAIQECIGKEVKTPEECARFYADYGNAGATQFGTFRQRMFHDIPECQSYYEAEKDRNSRTSR